MAATHPGDQPGGEGDFMRSSPCTTSPPSLQKSHCRHRQSRVQSKIEVALFGLTQVGVHGRLTGPRIGPRTPTGFHVPDARDTTGEAALYAPGAAVFTRPAQVPRSPPAASQRCSPAPRSHIPSPRAQFEEASSRVRLRSPVRSSPRL